jgi:hypothetical protein
MLKQKGVKQTGVKQVLYVCASVSFIFMPDKVVPFNFTEPTGGTDIPEACVGHSVVITEF